MTEKGKPARAGHGGARPGSGRLPVRLADLLRDGTFRWDNARHRRALLEGDAPLELGSSAWAREVEGLVEAYRRSPHRPTGHWFAQRLEALVRGRS